MGIDGYITLSILCIVINGLLIPAVIMVVAFHDKRKDGQ